MRLTAQEPTLHEAAEEMSQEREAFGVHCPALVDVGRADGVGTFIGCNFRTYPEMFYSGALTAEQTDAMYVSGQGLTTCEVGRWLNMGSPNAGGGGGLTFVHIPQGTWSAWLVVLSMSNRLAGRVGPHLAVLHLVPRVAGVARHTICRLSAGNRLKVPPQVDC